MLITVIREYRRAVFTMEKHPYCCTYNQDGPIAYRVAISSIENVFSFLNDYHKYIVSIIIYFIRVYNFF